MYILRQADVLSTLDSLSPTECRSILAALSQNLILFSTPSNSSDPPQIHQPLRTSITGPSGHTSLFMPACNPKTTGIKTVTVHSAPGGGAHLGSVTLFSPEGELKGIINAEELTGFRTALVSMLLFSQRCWDGPGEIVIFGAGKQAEWHSKLGLLLGPKTGTIGKITFVGRRVRAMEEFDTRVLTGLREQYPRAEFVTIASDGNGGFEDEVKAAVGRCQALFCCTPSREALFPASYLKSDGDKKRYISLIGSYKPWMQEVDTETLLSGKLLCVDSKEGCLKEAGEMHTGKVTAEQVTEIGELLSRIDNDSESLEIIERENLVFKCVGMGVMDLAVGQEVLNMAISKGFGVKVDNF